MTPPSQLRLWGRGFLPPELSTPGEPDSGTVGVGSELITGGFWHCPILMPPNPPGSPGGSRQGRKVAQPRAPHGSVQIRSWGDPLWGILQLTPVGGWGLKVGRLLWYSGLTLALGKTLLPWQTGRGQLFEP